MAIVVLHPDQTRVHCPDDSLRAAVRLACRVTMSPHEWKWTPDEAALMAQYVLWACQRLEAINQLASGELNRPAE